jgi:tripartite-type tricarboxylate transporter receptor subunit TctC
LSAVVALVMLLSPWVQAQDRLPTRLIVPVSAGSSLDVQARKFAERMTQTFDQSVIVENRPGASGMIGTEYVARSQPDGRTLLMAASFVPINVVMYKAAIDPVRELKPVIKLVESEVFLAANSSLGVSRPGELAGIARARSGGLNCAAVPGYSTLGCEQLRVLLGGAITTIPYSGTGPASQALLAGQVDLLIGSAALVGSLTGGGKVQVVAAMGSRAARPPLSGLPLARDTWPGFVIQSWIGVFVAAGTRDAIVDDLNRKVNTLLVDPALVRLLTEQGYAVGGGTPEQLGRALSDDIVAYGRMLAAAGIAKQ